MNIVRWEISRVYRFLLLAITVICIQPAIASGEIAKGNPKAFTNAEGHCFAILQNLKGERIARRIAFRRLVYDPQTFRLAVVAGLKDLDPGIRGLAVYELYRADGKKSMPVCCSMVRDKSTEVRDILYVIGFDMQNREKSDNLLRLLQKNQPDSGKVSKVFRYYRINNPISQSPTYDHEIVKLKTIKLPFDNWAFRTDPGNVGHIEKWFAPNGNVSGWKRISVNAVWEKQGFPNYDGIAWYRVKFRMPPKIKCLAVELSFGGVDESAWVWLNGKYIGQHDMGPDGWNIPFKLDITSEISWNAENHLAVRVKDTTMAGGIYKPVSVEILK